MAQQNLQATQLISINYCWARSVNKCNHKLQASASVRMPPISLAAHSQSVYSSLFSHELLEASHVSECFWFISCVLLSLWVGTSAFLALAKFSIIMNSNWTFQPSYTCISDCHKGNSHHHLEIGSCCSSFRLMCATPF